MLAWYDKNARDLPWRKSTALYPVLVSEVMLQQTRVEAVIPYYLAFLARFPDAVSLATVAEADVLTAWAGLGYYSRARNLRLAAGVIAASSPGNYAEILRLPGVGPYTAAALASICLHEPFAAVDGNVLRVVSRITNDPSEISVTAVKKRFGEVAQYLLDPERPGDFNQAMMELGATVCVPAKPGCTGCPVQRYCAARVAGSERSLPVKLGKPRARRVALELLVCEVAGRIWLKQRGDAESRLAGFWELPELPEGLDTVARQVAEFRHQIVNDRFEVRVWAVQSGERPPVLRGGRWLAWDELGGLPLSTIARKALALVAAERIDVPPRQQFPSLLLVESGKSPKA